MIKSSVFMFGEQEMGGVCEKVHRRQNWYHLQKATETVSNQRRFLKLSLPIYKDHFKNSSLTFWKISIYRKQQ